MQRMADLWFQQSLLEFQEVLKLLFFLGILVLHGIDPGPTLLLGEREGNLRPDNSAYIVCSWSICYWACLQLNGLVKITFVNVNILVPLVVTISLTGVYVLQGKPGDVLMASSYGYCWISYDSDLITRV